MSVQSEIKTIRDFLYENPNHLEVALAVYENWPSIRDDVCKRFLGNLRDRIRCSDVLKPVWNDTAINVKFVKDALDSNGIWLNCSHWKQINALALVAAYKGSNGWFMGVHTSLPIAESHYTNLHFQLSKKLGKSDARVKSEFVWWRWVDDDMQNWQSLIPALHRECESCQRGKYTKYFVDAFVDFAAKALPVVDEIERR